MRASEFLSEQRTIGTPTKRQSFAMRGLHKFRDPGGYDRTYELNRIIRIDMHLYHFIEIARMWQIVVYFF